MKYKVNLWNESVFICLRIGDGNGLLLTRHGTAAVQSSLTPFFNWAITVLSTNAVLNMEDL